MGRLAGSKNKLCGRLRMNPRKVYPSAEEIAEDMARGYKSPFDARGKHWQGSIFFSNIYERTKKQSPSVTQKVDDLLRGKGYYIHTNPVRKSKRNIKTKSILPLLIIGAGIWALAKYGKQ